jgi:uncharacterized protein (TIGR03435 family)
MDARRWRLRVAAMFVATVGGRMTRTVASCVLAGFLGALASAQEPKPRFEVASVKPSGPVTPSGGTWTDMMNSGLRRLPDGITAPQETVHGLVIRAYGVLPYQIVGGPDWMKSDRFEITAKAGADVPGAQIQLMMQSLLEDRFKLVAHREQREMRHQTLVLAKADRRLGPGLFRMDVACTPAMINELRQKFPEKYASPFNGVMSGCSAAGVGGLASSLTSRLGTPVIDRTGLEGPFHYAFSAQLPARPVSPSLGAPTSDPADLPALSTGLEEQLGLKLESGKGPIEVLVIDSVSRPSEN